MSYDTEIPTGDYDVDTVPRDIDVDTPSGHIVVASEEFTTSDKIALGFACATLLITSVSVIVVLW